MIFILVEFLLCADFFEYPTRNDHTALHVRALRCDNFRALFERLKAVALEAVSAELVIAIIHCKGFMWLSLAETDRALEQLAAFEVMDFPRSK